MKVKFLAGHDTHERERLMRQLPPIRGFPYILLNITHRTVKWGK